MLLSNNKSSKRSEFNHFRNSFFQPLGLVLAEGSGQGTSLGYLGQNFVPNLDIGLVRSVRVGLQTHEAKYDVAALAYNSRLRGDITFVSSYSDYTQNLGYIGCFVNL